MLLVYILCHALLRLLLSYFCYFFNKFSYIFSLFVCLLTHTFIFNIVMSISFYFYPFLTNITLLIYSCYFYCTFFYVYVCVFLTLQEQRKSQPIGTKVSAHTSTFDAQCVYHAGTSRYS